MYRVTPGFSAKWVSPKAIKEEKVAPIKVHVEQVTKKELVNIQKTSVIKQEPEEEKQEKEELKKMKKVAKELKKLEKKAIKNTLEDIKAYDPALFEEIKAGVMFSHS